MASYEVDVFHGKVQHAMERVRLLLHATRAPCFAADVHHKYEDKYVLADSMTNAAVASQLNALQALGVSREQLLQMQSWARSDAISLRFRSEERCSFVREENKEVESPARRISEASVTGAVQAAVSAVRRSVTKVTEYVWQCE